MRYKVKPYNGKITVFKSKSISNVVDPFLGWKNVETGGIDLVNLSAYQNGILVSPFVKELADRLNEILEQKKLCLNLLNIRFLTYKIYFWFKVKIRVWKLSP